MKLKQFVMHRHLGLGIAFLLLGAPVVGLLASGQETNAVVDPYPLRPPDISSPRDTLRSFLANADKAIEAWRRNAQDNISDRAWMSALMALNFSTTPDSDSWSVQTERVLLLKEVLDRVEIPAESKIPGDDEVARDGIIRWHIPNTWIVIARVESGPRAGEFLFSAETVERLFRSYMLVKDLPYKPTATTAGIYEDYTSSDRTLVALERQLRLRLRRVDTSSPRSTLRAFLDNVDRAYALAMDADKALKATPSTMTKQEALEIEKTANDHLRRAAATLDLSRVPEAYRKAASTEAVLKLKEILDRTLLPTLDSIPDIAYMAAVPQQEGQASRRAGAPFRWRYPNTEIEIVEIMEGDRQGEYLFSASTVSQIGVFYDRIRQLPYRSEIARAKEGKYIWSKISEGFYDYFISNPGYLVPRASFMGGLVDTLPGWFKTVCWGLTIWQWVGLFLCLTALVLVVFTVLRILRLIAARFRPPLNGWLQILAPILILLLLIVASHVIGESLNITGRLRIAITMGVKTIGIAMVIWAVTRLCKAVAETIIASPKIRDRSLDASLLRITMRLLAFVIGAWIFIVSIRDLGADLLPLVAGLGVGGLAVALAAQRTLANFIGSLNLFANKPVKPGDFCRYGDHIGTVEHIGLLSTRIRSLERTIVTVPNAEFSEIKLENYAMRDQRLFKTVLQLRYETTPEQMRYILAKLRELLLGHPKVAPDPARGRFIGYGAYSKDVEVFAYLNCQDQNTFLAIQEDILLRIENIISEAGSGFAFPSQTTYLTRDTGVDAKRGEGAAARVQQWRDTGKFPFPEFAEKQREQLKDTLDYPPKGSPDYEFSEVASNQQQPQGASSFSEEDIVNLPSFATELQEPNQVADYLWGRLSVKTQQLLSNYSSESDAEARKALTRDLNVIIQQTSIYTVDRFSEVRRRPETQALLEVNPQGEELVQLNRMLLEDAFPKELAR